MKEIEALVGLAQAFLDGQLAGDRFADEFIGLLFDHEEEIYGHDKRVHALLDDIREGAALFESQDAVREADGALLSEDQLRRIVRTALEKLSRHR